MKNLQYLIIYISTATAFLQFSCSKTEFKPAVADSQPVVQSFLYADADSIRVSINKIISYNGSDTAQEAVSQLKVYINDTLLPETQTGTYAMKRQQKLQQGHSYTLRFAYNNDTVTATTLMPQKPSSFAISVDSVKVTRVTTTQSAGSTRVRPPQWTQINLSWDNPNNDYHYIIVECLDENLDYVNEYAKEKGIGERSTTSRPNQDDAATLDFRQLSFYGHYRIVLCRINKEYYDLYQTTNGNSSSITNAPSNLQNAWGIFTGISTDTVFLKVYE